MEEDVEITELAPEYDSRDSIPEAHRAFYREAGNGKFRVAIAEHDSIRLEDVKGLRTVAAERKAKLDRTRRERDELQARIDAMSNDDDDDETPKNGKKQSGPDNDARLRQLESKHQEAMKKRDALLAKRTDQLRKLMEEEAILRHLPDGANKKVLLPALKERIRTVETDDGTLATHVFDPGSDVPRMTNRENSTDPMGVEEFMSTIVPREFKDWFPGTKSAGGGAGGSNGDGGPASGGSEVTISREDARDTERYRAARAKAKKKGVPLRIVD